MLPENPGLEGPGDRLTASPGGPIFPSPTAVVGVGALGLEVLERLGADWEALRLAGGDETLENLRLVHVEPRGESEEPWRRLESPATRLARHAGESDLPSLALNLVVLRALGLVRFRDGTYEVALPRDAGVVEGQDLALGAEDDPESESLLHRRRYFDWLGLSPDPVTAVERLYRLAEGSSELDLFITPILNRVRQGHSPRALLACIGRCHALAGGRDPSPWPWVQALARRQAGGLGNGARREPLALHIGPREPETWERLGLSCWDVTAVSHPFLGLLDRHAPPPLPGWEAFLRERLQDPAELDDSPGSSLELHVPGPFVPCPGDLELWLDPLELLRVDWETAGWATGETGAEEMVQYRPVEVSAFRLGLFDHDAVGQVASGGSEHPLEPRLRALADLARRGLVRLWIDLQRDRVEESAAHVGPEDRRREDADEALRQSLEILGELLIRPLAEAPDAASSEEQEAPAETTKPAPRASARLRSLDLGPLPGEERGTVHERLERRLGELGVPGAGPGSSGRPLLRSVALAPADLEAPRDEPPGGLGELARVLNRQVVRELLHIRWSERYRQRPVRRPPRLTLYLVGDLGEPFVRGTLRTILREMHAELLRAFSSVFEHYREGFDRSLSIVPILWMPHPADPFAGDPRPGRAEEEAAIVDAIQGIRRWVESVIPSSRRRVSQIFVNSFLTNTAVLDRDDAVRQTRDFITLQARNDLGADDWLRRTAVGPAGDDFFSSFACYEIEFPAETAQQYLANRLARDLLRHLRARGGGAPEPLDERVLTPPPVDDLLRRLGPRLRARTDEEAARVSQAIESRCAPVAETEARKIVDRFGEDFGRWLAREMQTIWSDMVRHLGAADTWTEDLRSRARRQLGEALHQVRLREDEWMQSLAEHRGLDAVRAGFLALRRTARERLESAEAVRLREQERCGWHGVPDPAVLEERRREVVAAAEAKPDLRPMAWGLGLWLLLCPVLGGALAVLVSTWLGPGDAGRLVDTYGPWLGSLAVAGAGCGWLGASMDRALARLRARIEALARAAGELVSGGSEGVAGRGPASIHTFFAARFRLAAAVAGLGFSARVDDRAATDQRRLERVDLAVELQLSELRRRAERLGARPRAEGAESEPVDDLFDRGGRRPETLVDPRSLVAYFERRWHLGAEIGGLLPEFLDAAGDLAGWRQKAPLADTDTILTTCRRPFATLGRLGLGRQHPFAEEAGAGLRAFVARHYSNIGFGARFEGSEGLDPDGVHLLASAALVLPPELETLYGRWSGNGQGSTRTMPVVPCGVRSHTAYMLSLAQGIRPHTVRNLRRFESFHDRATLPEDRTFPLSGDGGARGSLNRLSACNSLAAELHEAFAGASEVGPGIPGESR